MLDVDGRIDVGTRCYLSALGGTAVAWVLTSVPTASAAVARLHPRLGWYFDPDIAVPGQSYAVQMTDSVAGIHTAVFDCQRVDPDRVKSTPLPEDVKWFDAVPDMQAYTDVTVSGTEASSATGGFTNALLGKSIVAEGAALRPLTGTFATTSGKRIVIGTGTKCSLELWEDGPITIGGVAFTVSHSLTGTFATTAGSPNVVGTSSKVDDELVVGQEIQLGGDRKYLVATITDPTHFSVDRDAAANESGLAGRLVEMHDTRLLLNTNASATASGLTAYGSPNPLITTIAAVPSSTRLTLATAATISVTGARAWIGTNNAPAIHAAMERGYVEVPPGDYLLATSLQVSRAKSHVHLLPGARWFVANRIELNAEQAKLTGPGQGLVFADNGEIQIAFIGGSSPRDTPIVMSGISPGANNMTLEGIVIDRYMPAVRPTGGMGATGLFIGRLGPTPTSGILIRDVVTIDFQNGTDIGGMQTSTIENLWNLRRFNGGVQCRSTGDGLRMGAYLDPGMGAPQCQVVSSIITGGKVHNFQRAVVMGGRGTTDGGYLENVFDRMYLGSDNPLSHDLFILIRYTQNNRISNCLMNRSPVSDNLGVQLGSPGAGGATGNRPDNLELRGNTITSVLAPIVGYTWQNLKIRGSNSLTATGASGTSVFRNYGATYYRQFGRWERPAVSFGAATGTDLDDSTGFDYVDATNITAGNPAQSTRYANQHVFVAGVTLKTTTGAIVTSNAGSPEGVVTAEKGSYCADTTNGEGYIKNSGSGNTGWKLVTHA